MTRMLYTVEKTVAALSTNSITKTNWITQRITFLEAMWWDAHRASYSLVLAVSRSYFSTCSVVFRLQV